MLLAWRERVTKALEPFRAQKNKSVDARVTLHARRRIARCSSAYAAELADLFIVSAVGDRHAARARSTSRRTPGRAASAAGSTTITLAADPTDVCERCADALRGEVMTSRRR